MRLVSASLRVTTLLVDAARTTSAIPVPDAGLFRLCAKFHGADARWRAAPDDGMGWKVWLDHRWEITASIKRMMPHSEAGRQAKARVALVLLEKAADTSNEYERFALTTLRDLAGSAAA